MGYPTDNEPRSGVYNREPCYKDCWGDGLHNAHYHEVGGEDMLRKVDNA